MSKITLNDVGSLISSTTAVTTINDNSSAIEDAFENTLSRDGTAPNQMESNLDMNSNRILNLPVPVSETEPVRKKELDDLLISDGVVLSVNGETGIVVLNTDDLSDTDSDHKFVTAADITTLSNTFGTNTGDQTSVTGNAGTATKLQTARTINGVSFDGTSNITVVDNSKVPTTTSINGHLLNTPVVVISKSDVSLGNVDNTSDATKNSATATLTNKTLTTPVITGVTDGSNASAGSVGEYVTSSLASGSALSLTTNAAKTIVSITLTAGDWDVTGLALFIPANTTSVTSMLTCISNTDNTLVSTTGLLASNSGPARVFDGNNSISNSLAPYRFSLTSTTTLYLVCRSTFTVSTCTAYGIISARRVR